MAGTPQKKANSWWTHLHREDDYIWNALQLRTCSYDPTYSALNEAYNDFDIFKIVFKNQKSKTIKKLNIDQTQKKYLRKWYSIKEISPFRQFHRTNSKVIRIVLYFQIITNTLFQSFKIMLNFV